MKSRVCSNQVIDNAQFKTTKPCGAKTFYEDNEQCPKYCSHCKGVLNPDFDEDLANLKDDGPTIMEYVDAGFSALKYPPKGYTAKPWTKKDYERLDELSETEDKYNELIKSMKAGKAAEKPSEVKTDKVEEKKA